jgi:hypothetical protein
LANLIISVRCVDYDVLQYVCFLWLLRPDSLRKEPKRTHPQILSNPSSIHEPTRMSETMCIKIHCRICGDIINTTSLSRTRCDKPECRQRRHDPRKSVLICKECGGVIPVGSGRRYYCSEDCNRIATQRYRSTYDTRNLNVPARNDIRPDCPHCSSNKHINKYGVRAGLPRWYCVPCRKSFIVDISNKVTAGEIDV